MKRIVIGLFIILFPVLPAFSQTSIEAKVDGILDKYYGADSPGVSVMVIQNGEVKFSKNYGYANLEEQVKATASTNYHLASLTRQFTVMSVLMLEEEGKAKLNQSITEIWEGLPGYCSKVTVYHLLRSTSGLPHLPHGKFYWDVKKLKDLKTFLASHEQIAYQPGKRATANPLNTALLAAYIEKISGETCRKFIEKNIFKPLGMDDSRVYRSGWFVKVPNKASSYNRGNNDDYHLTSEFLKDYYEGVIGIFCSLNDMQKWMQAWDSDTLISRKKLNAVKRINFIRGQKQFPGYGWNRGFNTGQKYLYAAGVGHGNTHIMLEIPNENIDVIILSNQYPLFGLREKAFELVNLFSE